MGSNPNGQGKDTFHGYPKFIHPSLTAHQVRCQNLLCEKKCEFLCHLLGIFILVQIPKICHLFSYKSIILDLGDRKQKENYTLAVHNRKIISTFGLKSSLEEKQKKKRKSGLIALPNFKWQEIRKSSSGFANAMGQSLESFTLMR